MDLYVFLKISFFVHFLSQGFQKMTSSLPRVSRIGFFKELCEITLPRIMTYFTLSNSKIKGYSKSVT